MHIYRATTYYHLMIILLIVKKTDENILYLDSEILFSLREGLVSSNIFNKVYINKCLFRKNILIRNILTILYAFIHKVASKLINRYHILITPQTNICGKLYYQFLKVKSIYLIEDGQYTYQKYIDTNINSLYENSSIKNMFNSYFLTIHNPYIKKYFIRFPEKLSNTCPKEYAIIKNKINIFNLEYLLKSISSTKKLALKNIFFKKDIRINNKKKTLILLTQPYVEKDTLNTQDLIDLYKAILNKYDKNKYTFYIKEHPREKPNKYNDLIKTYNLQIIDKYLPFEFLSLFDISFDVGITYDSTAIYSNLINEKLIIKDTL